MAKDDHEHYEKPALKESSPRPRIAVRAEQGEFHHQAEEAERPCVTSRPAPQCGCGAYDLDWSARAAEIQAP